MFSPAAATASSRATRRLAVAGARLASPARVSSVSIASSARNRGQGREFRGQPLARESARCSCSAGCGLMRSTRGGAIYYDRESIRSWASIARYRRHYLPANGRFTEDIELHPIAFDRADTDERVLHGQHPQHPDDVSVHEGLSIRAIVQYNSQQRRVLTDFLGSYELRPGTVVYAGYERLRKARVPRRAVDRATGPVCRHRARALIQSVVSASFLTASTGTEVPAPHRLRPSVKSTRDSLLQSCGAGLQACTAGRHRFAGLKPCPTSAVWSRHKGPLCLNAAPATAVSSPRSLKIAR